MRARWVLGIGLVLATAAVQCSYVTFARAEQAPVPRCAPADPAISPAVFAHSRAIAAWLTDLAAATSDRERERVIVRHREWVDRYLVRNARHLLFTQDPSEVPRCFRASAGLLILARRFNDPCLLASAYSLRGRLAREGFRYLEALSAMDQARRWFAQAGDTTACASCDLYTSHLFAQLDAPDASEAACRQAIPLLEAAGRRREVALGWMGLSELHLAAADRARDPAVRRTRLEAAKNLYLQARPVMEAEGDTSNWGLCLASLADIEARSNRPSAARALYEEAREVLGRKGDATNVVRCSLWISDLEARAGHFNEALRLVRGTLPHFLDQERKVDLAESYLRIGKLNRRLGRRNDAAHAFRLALACLEELRTLAGDAELAASAYGEFAELPTLLAATEMEQGVPSGAEAIRLYDLVQRGKGAVLREVLLGQRNSTGGISAPEQERLNALQQAYHRASTRQERQQALTSIRSLTLALRARYPLWRRLSASPATAAEVARALDGRTALLEVLPDEKALCLVLVTRGRAGEPHLRLRRIPVSRADLEQAVLRFQTLVRDDAHPAERTALARRLFEQLVQPVQPYLAGKQAIVICPDQFLHNVPFAALQDARGRYLIERYAVTQAPSGSAWEACRAVQARKAPGPAEHPLVVARWDYGSTAGTATRSADVLRDGKSFPDLPGARIEAASVRRAFGGRTVALLQQGATVPAVRRAAPRASTIHIACHAAIHPRAPEMNALVLTPSGPTAPGLLFAGDIARMSLQSDLAVLSACSTARGPLIPGEGLQSLARSFLLAGCPSIVASRWDVQDQAARRWVVAFYGAYRHGAPKAASYQAACRALLRDPAYRSPRHWAAWGLFGSDR